MTLSVSTTKAAKVYAVLDNLNGDLENSLPNAGWTLEGGIVVSSDDSFDYIYSYAVTSRATITLPATNGANGNIMLLTLADSCGNNPLFLSQI